MRLPIASGAATGAVALTLYPLFSEGSWFWATLGVLLCTTAAAVLVSRFAQPAFAAPIAMALAAIVFMTVAFAHDEAWWGFIPNFDSTARIAELMAGGWDEIQKFAAPVPSTTGISLLTAGGVAFIAMLVDAFAVRVRRAALAGLPLLGLFTVPAAVLNEPIAWPAFVIGALGFVGLLVSDGRERVSHWGRAVLVRRSRTTTTTPDAGKLVLSGKRIGVTAVALAIGLPALIPTLTPNPPFGFGVGNGLGPGGRNVGIPDAIAKLSGQLSHPVNAPVLTYTSKDDVPRYLRIYSLDEFDGQQFKSSSLRGRPEDRVSESVMPPPPGLSVTTPGVATDQTITVSEDIEELRFLPLPYPATQVIADGDWRADRNTLMVFSTEDDAAGLEYQVIGKDVRPEPEMLESAPQAPIDVQGRFLTLPADIDPAVVDLAAQVTQGATSDYQRAVMLQEFFTRTGGFTYDLQTRGSGLNALTDFLLVGKAGYCEQFASAFAVMARILGIPSRVSIGYTGGTKSEGRWIVRTHDAHAWPELYFEGAGWLTFEPTPSGGLGQATARVPSYTLPQSDSATPSPGASARPSSDPAASPGANSPARGIDNAERELGPTGLPAAEETPLWVKIGIGVAVALLLSLIPALMRAVLWLWRRRVLNRAAAVPDEEVPVVRPGKDDEDDGWGGGEVIGGEPVAKRPVSVWAAPEEPVAPPPQENAFAAPAVEAAWAELCDTLIDLGMPKAGSETPRALGRRLTAAYPLDTEAAKALTKIATSEEKLRYARTPGEITPLVDDLKAVRRGLAASVSRGRRIAAVLAPMSALLRVRGLGERILDGFDRLEGIRLRPSRKERETATPDDVLESQVGSRR
ncbi:transglutaminase family protein [Herbidospora cretacea]|uniref:transglutaminase family protein n=1 Tax=Herbidospora cretacea TaxID=28444 RepID=UPI00077337FB|nr:DUF3488 and transglutaminase-like domain-containing protein [Herbidospora cretacea]